MPATAADADISQAETAQASLVQELTMSAESYPEPGVFLDPPDAPQPWCAASISVGR